MLMLVRDHLRKVVRSSLVLPWNVLVSSLYSPDFLSYRTFPAERNFAFDSRRPSLNGD